MWAKPGCNGETPCEPKRCFQPTKSCRGDICWPYRGTELRLSAGLTRQAEGSSYLLPPIIPSHPIPLHIIQWIFLVWAGTLPLFIIHQWLLCSPGKQSPHILGIGINRNSHLFYLSHSLLFTKPSLVSVLLVPLFSTTKMDVEFLANRTVQQMAAHFMLYWTDCLVFS